MNRIRRNISRQLTTVALIVFSVAIVFLTGCEATPNSDATLKTFKELDDVGLYTLDYSGDYEFDKFLTIGSDSDEKLASFITESLLDGTDIEIKVPGAGCTTFTGEIENGDRILARNFDYGSAIPMVIKTNPNNGYKSISTVNLEFIGYSDTNLPNANDKDSLLPLLATPYIPLDGVNEKGLAIGILQINWYAAKQTDSAKVTLPTTAMMRMVLDKAATVDEALALMRAYNISDSLGSNFHYQLADRTGKSVVVEYVSNPIFNTVDMIIVNQDANEDYLCAENFLLSPMGSLLQTNFYPEGIGPKRRYGILREALELNNGAFSNAAQAMDLLVEAGQGDATHWSVIYNLGNSTSIIVANQHYSKQPKEFSV